MHGPTPQAEGGDGALAGGGHQVPLLVVADQVTDVVFALLDVHYLLFRTVVPH